jgi:Ca2+-binding EF-hand superfamily protein
MTAVIVADERLRQRFARWDTDGDNRVAREDFEREAIRVSGAFGRPADSAEAAALRQAMARVFDYHLRQVGAGPECGLTEEEFVTAERRIMRDDREFRDLLRPCVRALIVLCDKNQDGRINQAEFTTWLKGIGGSATRAWLAFRRIDADHDGQLGEDELLDAMCEFHYGQLDASLLV